MEAASSDLTSHAKVSFSRLLGHLCLLFHPHSRGTLSEECDTFEHATNPPAHMGTGSLPPDLDLSSLDDPSIPTEGLVDSVLRLGPSLPISCGLFRHNDLKITGPRPFDGGGFAKIWSGEKDDGKKVVIKSYRHYSSLSRLPAFLRFYQEALVCSYFNSIDDRSFAPFFGIYSSEEHPFALVFEIMEHRNLGEYLRNNKDVRRIDSLLQVARGLQVMHRHGIAHGNIKIANILVSGAGCVRIGSLGTACAQSTAPTVDVDRFFPGAAPEITDPQRWGTSEAGASKSSDLFAFGVLAWEAFTGRAPFSDQGVVACVHSMSNDRRPAKPAHPEVSDGVWKLIKGCWKADPAKRRTIDEVVAVLEVESNARQ
ncbi:kinase-like domain-containing protein [Thelephora terrestris]|uniref:Kinase-like domain-containing protein n=1 Tax=Thelephora terrestris TaxID=56493 RepID=A0A9P6L1A4_9AGAM|nr:kinase-like domain-containing protein [Thelephora terrestris]